MERAAWICTIVKIWCARCDRKCSQTDRERAGVLPPLPLVAMVKEGGETCKDTAIVSKAKGGWIIIQQEAPLPSPCLQVMNATGLPVHTRRAIVFHQSPSSVWQVKGLTQMIDSSGQRPCVTTLTVWSLVECVTLLLHDITYDYTMPFLNSSEINITCHCDCHSVED